VLPFTRYRRGAVSALQPPAPVAIRNRRSDSVRAPGGSSNGAVVHCNKKPDCMLVFIQPGFSKRFSASSGDDVPNHRHRFNPR
jgi:hypothetical protein